MSEAARTELDMEGRTDLPPVADGDLRMRCETMGAVCVVVSGGRYMLRLPRFRILSLLAVLERAGWGLGWGHCNEIYFGGPKTICVNDCFEKKTEHLHGGVTIKTFRS